MKGLMLSHGITESFMPFRDKPVVFGCLGRTVAVQTETQSFPPAGKDMLAVTDTFL